LVTGLAAGYYLGTRAGRQRYDQINRQLTKLKNSDAFDEAAERARTVVTEGVEKARSLVDRGSDPGADTRAGGGGATSNGHGADTTPGIVVPGETAPDPTAQIVVVTTVEPPDTAEDVFGPEGSSSSGPEGYSSSR
jgi:hypothetical protein